MAKTSLQLGDLMTKAGVTSGVVYPPAVLELKQQYTFRNTGGASAGTIAVVGTAAELPEAMVRLQSTVRFGEGS